MKKLLVSLDYLRAERVGGICRYLQEIVPRLQASDSLEVSTFTTGTPPHPIHDFPSEIENHVHPVSWLRWRLWFTLAPRLASRRFRLPEHDLLWLPVPTTPGPRARNGKIVLSVLDIGPIAQPHCYSLAARTRWRRYLKTQLKLVDFFITPSEFTKDELIRCLGTPEDAISVIPLGSSITDNSVGALEQRPAKDPDHFVLLHIGSLIKKKGSDTLIRAFDSFQRSCSAARLVIVGDSLELNRSSREILESLKSKGRVTQISGISNDELLANYRRADVVVCPSRYEGFGLPVLEAMSLGVPVICSRIPPFEEIAGDRVFYFDTESPESLVEQMKNVYHSHQDLHEQIELGKKHAATFRWEESARRHRIEFERRANE